MLWLQDGTMPNSPVLACFDQNGVAEVKPTFNSNVGFFNIGWNSTDVS